MADSTDLNKAISQHTVWKINFVRNVIDRGNRDVTPAHVRTSHLCDFGKWMESLSPVEKGLEVYRKTQMLHEKFHRAAADVLQLALSGQRERSLSAVTELRSDFVYSSAQLVNALAGWKRHALKIASCAPAAGNLPQKAGGPADESAGVSCV